MNTQEVLLRVIHDHPDDELAWRALADHLEEQGQPDRAELLRLDLALREVGEDEKRPQREKRLTQLLAAGIRPCVPTLTNAVGMQLALIPPGSFFMGSSEGERGAFDSERPRHKVVMAQAYYLGT